MSIKRLAVMTSGGDAPGMNAFVRAVTRKSLEANLEVFGIYEGYQGMIDNQIKQMNYDSVCNIIQQGGTILKTSRSSDFMTVTGREQAARNLVNHNIDALICCGGNGSYAGLKALADPKDGQWQGLVLGVPGTIDNDVNHTDFTIGFDTAVNTAVEAIDKLRDTGDSHDMHFIVEVMGRHCGDIAKAVGIASGATNVLIPETESDVDSVLKAIRNKGHNITVIAEGDETGGALKLAETLKTNWSLIFNETSKPNFRVCILGHVQRGGRPTARDRILAHTMGEFAVEQILQGGTLQAVAIQKEELVLTKLQ